MSKTFLKNAKKKINTIAGEAKYVGTEIEDADGRWNQHYETPMYWVIHEGKKHHVYKT